MSVPRLPSLGWPNFRCAPSGLARSLRQTRSWLKDRHSRYSVFVSITNARAGDDLWSIRNALLLADRQRFRFVRLALSTIEEQRLEASPPASHAGFRVISSEKKTMLWSKLAFLCTVRSNSKRAIRTNRGSSATGRGSPTRIRRGMRSVPLLLRTSGCRSRRNSGQARTLPASMRSSCRGCVSRPMPELDAIGGSIHPDWKELWWTCPDSQVSCRNREAPDRSR